MGAREKAEKLHRRVNTFILSCVDENGYPLTKAVVPPIHRTSLDEIYFGTNTASKFAQAITKSSKSSVYFYSRLGIWNGCYLKGDMEIVTDLSVKEKYWNNKFKSAYSQKTFTDPDYCLLKFVPKKGRFYSGFKLEDFET
jgi:general stress protein 26